jgi:P-type E1-E2 ATPase
MLTVEIPGRGAYQLAHLVLDVNGTIAEDGDLIPGVKERLARLRRLLEVAMVTADTHGRQVAIDRELELEAERLLPGEPEAAQKAAVVRRLGAAATIAIGNGANDASMLKEAAIGIAVIEAEGACVLAVQNADVVCRSILDALDLAINPRRLVATLRQ